MHSWSRTGARSAIDTTLTEVVPATPEELPAMNVQLQLELQNINAKEYVVHDA
jgi:hypothetical protein